MFPDSVRKHCTILPNPIQISCVRSIETKHRIVNTARLTPQKNQALLIRAFAELYKNKPQYTLSIYGEGQSENDLRKLISEKGLESSVILEGRSSHVQDDISDAEIFVLSSDFEGLSNALLEAMMMGFPCISTDCEGATDIIQNEKNGSLIPRGDEDALFHALNRLTDDAAFRERLGKKALESVQDFRKEKVIEKWIDLIEST